MNANPHFPPTPWSIVNREELGWFIEDANKRAIAWIHTHDLLAEEAMLPEFRKLVESVNKDHENKRTAIWDGERYVCGQWSSADGYDWITPSGEPVTGKAFDDSIITLSGGPRNGQTVA